MKPNVAVVLAGTTKSYMKPNVAVVLAGTTKSYLNIKNYELRIMN